MPQVVLPNGMRVWAMNLPETTFLYREIFEKQAYLRNGIQLDDGDCVFDVGANIGLSSVCFAQLNEHLSIHLFEPVPTLFTLLQKNAALYLRNADVHLHNIALGRTAGTAVFQFDPHMSVAASMREDDKRRAIRSVTPTERLRALLQGMRRQNFGPQRLVQTLLAGLDRPVSRILVLAVSRAIEFVMHVSAARRRQTLECRVRTLSEMLAEYHVARVDLLKVDVEGSEEDVVLGIDASHWDRIRQIVLEVHDVDGRVARMTDLLRTKNFRVTVEQEDTPMYRILGLHMVYATREAAVA